jgi:anti-sigma regulatory factor (Ser/Thr protein kinase)
VPPADEHPEQPRARGAAEPDARGDNGVVRDPPQELRLDLPAVHSAARMARHLVRQFARASGVTGPELDNLILVADELLTNCVDHGGGNAALEESELVKPARMQMWLHVAGGAWEIHVSDQGGGDPEIVDELIHPKDLPNLEDERGRGLFLIAQSVDTLEVQRSADGLGLELIAVRRFEPGAG